MRVGWCRRWERRIHRVVDIDDNCVGRNRCFFQLEEVIMEPNKCRHAAIRMKVIRRKTLKHAADNAETNAAKRQKTPKPW